MITTSHDNGLQSSSFSAGVEAFLTVTSSSTSNLGSTVTTSSAAGCILAFSKGIRIRIIRQAIKFHGERTVLSIPMDSVRAPPVAAVTASVTSVAIAFARRAPTTRPKPQFNHDATVPTTVTRTIAENGVLATPAILSRSLLTGGAVAIAVPSTSTRAICIENANKLQMLVPQKPTT